MLVTYTGPIAPPITVRPAGTDITIDFTGVPLDVAPGVGRTLIDTGEWAEPGSKKPPSVDEIKTEVGDDPDKAAEALGRELARPNPRSTLVDHLSALVPKED